MNKYQEQYKKIIQEMTGKVSANNFNASKGNNKIKVDITSNDTLTFTVTEGSNSQVYSMDAFETKDLIKFLQKIK